MPLEANNPRLRTVGIEVGKGWGGSWIRSDRREAHTQPEIDCDGACKGGGDALGARRRRWPSVAETRRRTDADPKQGAHFEFRLTNAKISIEESRTSWGCSHTRKCSPMVDAERPTCIGEAREARVIWPKQSRTLTCQSCE